MTIECTLTVTLERFFLKTTENTIEDFGIFKNQGISDKFEDCYISRDGNILSEEKINMSTFYEKYGPGFPKKIVTRKDNKYTVYRLSPLHLTHELKIKGLKGTINEEHFIKTHWDKSTQKVNIISRNVEVNGL